MTNWQTKYVKANMISLMESNEQNKLTSKIDPEAWKHGTD